ncbi:MAG: VOC family protein [Phycisphaerales bacterium]
MPAIQNIHETILYADDVIATAAFYANILGLPVVSAADADGAGFRLPVGDAVLLIFRPAYAAISGRGVPVHGATGPGHVAFRIAPGTLPQWAEAFATANVAIELERDWSQGGRSLYVRDPAGNSVELVDGRVWPDIADG